MRVVILAGGLGTRLQEETRIKPKPMVEVGGKPILWHIMKHYHHYGFDEFIIALGYKGEMIKRHFLDALSLSGDMAIDFRSGELERNATREDWLVRMVDTGVQTMTGGRVKRLRPWLYDATFMVTYGDGVSDVNLAELVKFHRSHGLLATVTAVRPPARYGGLIFNGDLVARFTEKPQAGEGWINGGFFVFEPGIFRYLDGDSSRLEVEALERLASDCQLAAYKHGHFWQCMDTLRDKNYLESLWQEGSAPWKTWSESHPGEAGESLRRPFRRRVA
jgi:glucose-1-phosphate cytidylyltransferase